MEKYYSVNKQSWDRRVPVHMDSAFYGMQEFRAGESSLNQYELELLGDVKGKSILHMQCHFGQDSISLARMGAHVVGVDLSSTAIEEARKLAQVMKVDISFEECNVINLKLDKHQLFDIVFTSYGTIVWLERLDGWAKGIFHHLKAGGKFIFVDFHPIAMMLDNDLERISYSYFNDGPIIEEEEGTYASKDNETYTSITWNHSISEIMQSLIDAGLTLQVFKEYPYSPYECFGGLESMDEHLWAPKEYKGKIPMVCAMVFSRV